MHIQHGKEKLEHLKVESKKQVLAGKMGGSKLTVRAKEAHVPHYLKLVHGKGEKHGWPKSHKQPGKSWEI